MATVKAEETHKTLVDQIITEPYCYLSPQQAPVLQHLGIVLPSTDCLPCWIPQRYVSQQAFGASAIGYLNKVQLVYGGPFVWATEFSNVHSTFVYDEVPFEIDGEWYGGPEQYFQLLKSYGTPGHEKARQLMKNATPDEAFSIGRSMPMRYDWEQVKASVMERAVRAKFTQNPALLDLLRASGRYPLVQLKPNDDFWGTGATGEGHNELGQILEQLRAELCL